MLRRARRPLRLPLGLLPLVLLLLLGVQRLVPVVEWQPQQRALVVTVPVPEAIHQARLQQVLLPTSTPRHYFIIPSDMNRQRRWISYTITGNARHDAATLRAAAERLRRGQTHPAEQADISIRFGPAARYAQLVAALDMMLQVGQQRYALDMYRPDPTLYVLARPEQLIYAN